MNLIFLLDITRITNYNDRLIIYRENTFPSLNKVIQFDHHSFGQDKSILYYCFLRNYGITHYGTRIIIVIHGIIDNLILRK